MSHSCYPSVWEGLFEDSSLVNPSAFREDASNFILDEEGLILRRSVGELPRIVLPQRGLSPLTRSTRALRGPQNLLGIPHPFLLDRALRDEVAGYICRYQTRSRVKPQRHKAGAGGAMPSGKWPFDVTSADAYKTGYPSEEGFEDIVSFACNRAGAIVTEATPPYPTSEVVADLLIRLVIHYFGCPRFFFCENWLVNLFVAKTIRRVFLSRTSSLRRTFPPPDRIPSVKSSPTTTHSFLVKELDDSGLPFTDGVLHAY